MTLHDVLLTAALLTIFGMVGGVVIVAFWDWLNERRQKPARLDAERQEQKRLGRVKGWTMAMGGIFYGMRGMVWVGLGGRVCRWPMRCRYCDAAHSVLPFNHICVNCGKDVDDNEHVKEGEVVSL